MRVWFAAGLLLFSFTAVTSAEDGKENVWSKFAIKRTINTPYANLEAGFRFTVNEEGAIRGVEFLALKKGSGQGALGAARLIPSLSLQFGEPPSPAGTGPYHHNAPWQGTGYEFGLNLGFLF